MATATVSLALAVVAIAAFAPPPMTGRLGLAVGIILAAFCLFEMLAFSLLVSFVSAREQLVCVNVLHLEALFLAW